MNQLNSVLIEGNVVRDVEFKTCANGKQLCTFTLANNRYISKGNNEYEQESTFIDCECWGALANIMSENSTKGSAIRVVGRFKQNKWVDNQGKSHSRIVLICEHVSIQQNKENATGSIEGEKCKLETDSSANNSLDISF